MDKGNSHRPHRISWIQLPEPSRHISRMDGCTDRSVPRIFPLSVQSSMLSGSSGYPDCHSRFFNLLNHKNMELKQIKPVHIYSLTADEINAELLEFIEQAGMSDISEVMDANPDMLNMEEHRISFVEFDTDYSKWIVYLNTEAGIRRERIEKILLCFFGNDWKDHFKLQERNWAAFKHGCIAYRGSQGVHYEIWKSFKI
jgi:hypothetical protein